MMCVCAAHGQDPSPPPAGKKKMKVDGVAVEKHATRKLEGVQKTVSGHVEVAGGKIYYEECGSGPAAVVLLHDQWLHSGDLGRQVAAAVRSKYHTVRYDRRGYGKIGSCEGVLFPRRRFASRHQRSKNSARGASRQLNRRGRVARLRAGASGLAGRIVFDRADCRWTAYEHRVPSACGEELGAA